MIVMLRFLELDPFRLGGESEQIHEFGIEFCGGHSSSSAEGYFFRV